MNYSWWLSKNLMSYRIIQNIGNQIHSYIIFILWILWDHLWENFFFIFNIGHITCRSDDIPVQLFVAIIALDKLSVMFRLGCVKHLLGILYYFISLNLNCRLYSFSISIDFVLLSFFLFFDVSIMYS